MNSTGLPPPDRRAGNNPKPEVTQGKTMKGNNAVPPPKNNTEEATNAKEL